MAFLVTNDMLQMNWIFFVDGQRSLHDILLRLFAWQGTVQLILDWHHLEKKCEETMFLHKPLRIAALGFVFAIALMLYRILQYVLRNRLRKTDETIAGHHGRITMETPTGVQSWMQGFTEVHRRILTLFGLPSDLYERVDLVG